MSIPASRGSPCRAAMRLGAVLIIAMVLTGCNVVPSSTGSPSPGAPTETGSPTVTGSPLAPTGSPTVTGSPLTPSESGSPTVTGSPLAPSGSPSGSIPSGAGPSGSVAPVDCTEVAPVRVEKVTAEPRRTLEVVTLVSDGRNLTPGTREQSDFQTPVLTAPDGKTFADEATMQKVATLIASSSRKRVLLTPPEPPDEGADVAKRPYDAPGTYVAYSASTTLNAGVIVNCSGTEQPFRFRAESDKTLGVVNCAVEPPQSNAVARQVFASNC